MSLITASTKVSTRFTREEDELIVTLANEKKTNKQISEALNEAGWVRTPASIAYRISKLKTYNSFDEINYATDEADEVTSESTDKSAE